MNHNYMTHTTNKGMNYRFNETVVLDKNNTIEIAKKIIQQVNKAIHTPCFCKACIKAHNSRSTSFAAKVKWANMSAKARSKHGKMMNDRKLKVKCVDDGEVLFESVKIK